MQVPFGLFFEEPAKEEIPTLLPKYSAVDSISFIETVDGQTVPFVLLPFLAGTQTVTRIRTENTDSDPDESNIAIGTQSATKIRAESTDVD